VWGGHLEILKQEIEAGTARDCFIGELVKHRQTVPQEKWEGMALDDYSLGKDMDPCKEPSVLIGGLIASCRLPNVYVLGKLAQATALL
jgi:hypothetical protein